MKKALTIIGIFSLILFLSCMTYDYEEAEYYSVEEVIEAWEDGIYDYDLDQQMSAYWPDAYGFIHLDLEGISPERFGKDEIEELFDIYTDNDDYDLEDFEFPPYIEIVEVENEVVTIIYYYEDMMREEVLTLTNRDGLWGIQDHYFNYFEPRPVNSLTAWIDENSTGQIEPWERTELNTAAHILLFDPHPVETGLDEIFDTDRNNFIDEGELIFARTYFAFFAIPEMAHSNDWFPGEFIDLNRNGEAEPFEVESVAEYLLTWENREPLDRPAEDPLYQYLDENGDGVLEIHEKNSLFWHITGVILNFFDHPEDPMAFMGEDRDMAVVMPAPSNESPVQSNNDALERIKGKRVAVIDITSETDKINEETRKGLVFFVENSFVNTGLVKVVDRKSIDKIYEENRFQSSGMTDEETAVEIGKIVGAEIIVTGSVTAVGSNFYLNLRMTDVKTGEVVASSLGEARIENEFLNMSSMAVDRLF